MARTPAAAMLLAALLGGCGRTATLPPVAAPVTQGPVNPDAGVTDYACVDGQTITAEGVVTHVDGSTSGYIEASLDTSFGGTTPLLGVDHGIAFADGLDWDNLVIGTAGVADRLTGTDGADKFTLTDLHAVDFIADYDFGQGDSVDLSVLLGKGSGATAENAANYVQYQGNALQVDVDGAANGHHFVDVALLDHPVADVKIIFDDGIDVTVNHIG